MRDVETTLAEMREFLPVASKDDEQRVRDLTERDIKRTLRDVRIPDVVIGRVLAQWPEFRADDEWVSLLASLVAWVDQCRVTSMSDPDLGRPRRRRREWPNLLLLSLRDLLRPRVRVPVRRWMPVGRHRFNDDRCATTRADS